MPATAERARAAQATVEVVGRGRLGTAISRALCKQGVPASAPLGRETEPTGFDAVLLCVPDQEIEHAAARIAPGPLVGHCSGATSLDVLAPHERFALHPLMTFTGGGGDAQLFAGDDSGGDAERFAGGGGDDDARLFPGAGAAIAGSTPRALAFARHLATTLEMRPFELTDTDRATYHAAASIASNFLVTLEGAAERLATSAGADRDALVPLVRATVDNWARLGARRALTGPVARGDERTVAAQREAIAERAPDLLLMFDALVDATRTLADSDAPVGATRALAGSNAPVDATRALADSGTRAHPTRPPADGDTLARATRAVR